jgi:microspherule protein 1
MKLVLYFVCLCCSVQSLPRGEHVLNFSDAEELINDTELTETQDEVLEQELAVADR